MAKILLVSDDEKQNKLITQILSKTPAAVITSVDESAVLNYVEKALVSLVLIDESIKTLDALILCKKMQAYTLKENIADLEKLLEAYRPGALAERIRKK